MGSYWLDKAEDMSKAREISQVLQQRRLLSSGIVRYRGSPLATYWA